MSWWSWIIAGTILFGAELGFVNAQFYLVFIGSAALVVGLMALMIPSLAQWAQWGVFGALAIVSMVAFRSRIYRRLRGNAPPVRTGPVGGVFTLPVTLAPGASCQAEYGGSFWTVRNTSEQPMASGVRVRITGVQGLTLLVRPDLESTS
jgi:membrane protein implicated in regulation of membrane protease activity